MLASLRNVLGSVSICGLLIVVAACGGTDGTAIDSSPTDPKDASADTATGSDAATADAADPPKKDAGADTSMPTPTCPTFDAEGPAVTSIPMVATAPPTPTGGTIPQGKFHLQDITLYTGPNGSTASIPINLQGTVVVTGNVVEQVLVGTAGGNKVAERTTMTFTTSGANATFTRTCPSPGTTTATFSATASSMLLFLKNDTGQMAAYRYAP